jgi:hypothetical protein
MSTEKQFLDFIYRNGKNVANKQTKMDLVWNAMRIDSRSKNCRFCKNVVDENEAVGVKTYWTVSDTRSDDWHVSNKLCANEGFQEEIDLCKSIDSACTDCLFFKRDVGIYGICTNTSSPKFDSKQFPSWGNTAEGNKCWTKRKDAI